MPVVEGDTILVPVAALNEQIAHPIDVTWSKDLTLLSEKYIQTTFTIITAKDGGKTGAETEGIIFVQLNMIDSFKAKQVAGQPELTIVVDKDFQYGQKLADGTGRWLAYHDKKHTPYQHRFISATIKTWADRAAGVAKMLGLQSVDSLVHDLGMFLGDYLHSF